MGVLAGAPACRGTTVSLRLGLGDDANLPSGAAGGEALALALVTVAGEQVPFGIYSLP